MPWLLARAKPTFSRFSINLTHGNRSRTMAALPSVEALSTTNSFPHWSTFERRKAARQQLTRVPVDDDDGKVGHASFVQAQKVRSSQRSGSKCSAAVSALSRT